jgi:putative hydroxymethylpyrimidine transporter CytX
MAQSPSSSSRVLSNSALSLIWFGAAVSLAEILSGTFFAPLGLAQGIAAIVIGHLIGCALFWLISFMSAQTGRTVMEAAKLTFGFRGSVAFSVANVIQLVGWTAVMIASGAAAAALLVPVLGNAAWSVIIGALIILWILIGTKRMAIVQSIASVALLALTFVVSAAVFGSSTGTAPSDVEPIGFGAAVELACAMPLSWLPVAGDYLRKAKHPVAGTTFATAAYGLGSCWMFIIGLGLALFAASDDLTTVLASAGLGLVGIIVIVFSTVTTTFLDAESAGISFTAVFPHCSSKICGIIAGVLGVVLALVAPVANFQDFLYLIGSIFAPMAALMCVDWFVFHHDASHQGFDWPNIVLWIAGFVLYRCSMSWDFILGNTFPVMIIVAVASVLVHRGIAYARRRGSARAEH